MQKPLSKKYLQVISANLYLLAEKNWICFKEKHNKWVFYRLLFETKEFWEKAIIGNNNFDGKDLYNASFTSCGSLKLVQHYHLLSKIIKLEVEVEELQKASQHVNTCFHLLHACLISFYLLLQLFLFVYLSSTLSVYFSFINCLCVFLLHLTLSVFFSFINSYYIFHLSQLFMHISLSSTFPDQFYFFFYFDVLQACVYLAI